MNIPRITIGADPEVFVMKGDEFISGHDLIPGTKADPHRVIDGAVQVDGLALEFNIDPVDDANTFINRVNDVLHQLREMVPSEYDLAIEPAVHFSRKYMDTLPDKALELGCDPDFNAYTGRENVIPGYAPKTLRTGAGHIHIGWVTEGNLLEDPGHFADCCEFAKVLDLYLGVPSVVDDPSSERRQLYGKAGAFRPKPYGMEYRVLSNYWLKDDALMAKVFDNTLIAWANFYSMIQEKPTSYAIAMDFISRSFRMTPEDIINNNNVDAANQIVRGVL